MEQPNTSPPLSPEVEIVRLRETIENLSGEIARIQQRVSALESQSIAVPSARASDDRDQLESHFGLTIANRIGAVTLAVGIIFFFKYAADNDWIGASGLVLLGLLAGLALIAAGEWLRRRDDRAFAQGLAGCGFAILYISAYAAFGYEKLISRGSAFAAMLAASAFAIALCFRFRSPVVAAVGFIGAFVAPLLVRTSDDATSPWLYFAYLLLLSLVSVATVIRLYPDLARKSALSLAVFNAVWLLLTAWRLVENHHPSGFAGFALVFAAVHFAAAFVTRRLPLARAVFYMCAHGCFSIAMLRLIDRWATVNSAPLNRASLVSELDSVFLAFYGLIVIAYGVARKSPINRLLGLVLLGIVVLKLYIYDVWLMASFYRISALVALGVLLLAASYVYSRFKLRPAAKQ